MTYRELLELYKTGELELEQRKKVEKDIERQEAIRADYFSGGMCADFICTILPSNDCIMFLL